MKRIITFLICAIASIAIYAQVESEHMTFKGIPIDGSITEFVSKMKQKGFVFEEYNDFGARMKGEFAGNKGCTIQIYTNKKNNVYLIAVLFPNAENWSTLYSTYDVLKRNLTKKYGDYINCIEEFQGYNEPTDDNSKMHEVHMDRCKYNTTFGNEKGIILLSIMNYRFNAYVSLAYADKINGEQNEEGTIEDL